MHATFSQQPITELITVLKREREAAEKCHICFTEFNSLENRKVMRSLSLHGFISSINPKKLQAEISDDRPHIHCFL